MAVALLVGLATVGFTVIVHLLYTIIRMLVAQRRTLWFLLKMELLPMATLDDIMAEVEKADTIDGGLTALYNGLKSNQNDPVKLAAILNGLQAHNAKMSAFLLANTPQAPPPPAPPTDTTPPAGGTTTPPTGGTTTPPAGGTPPPAGGTPPPPSGGSTVPGGTGTPAPAG